MKRQTPHQETYNALMDVLEDLVDGWIDDIPMDPSERNRGTPYIDYCSLFWGVLENYNGPLGPIDDEHDLKMDNYLERMYHELGEHADSYAQKDIDEFAEYIFHYVDTVNRYDAFKRMCLDANAAHAVRVDNMRQQREHEEQRQQHNKRHKLWNDYSMHTHVLTNHD